MKIMILVALPEEVPTLFKMVTYKKIEPILFFTGVGKVNAAHRATKFILQHKPELVINYGTAGAIDKTLRGKLVQVGGFVQRDMDCSPLGFESGITPYEDTPKVIGDEYLVCGSGDSFVTTKYTCCGSDVVDMEAYAIAKVCKELSVPFKCFKYLSDEADENAGRDWKEFTATGEDLFIERLENENIYHCRNWD